MPITSLSLTNVGPFDEIAFEFDEHVNVLTGPNNSGKSTALMVLGDIVAFPFTMRRDLLRSGSATWRVRARLDEGLREFKGSIPSSPGGGRHLPLLQAIGYTTFVPALRRSTNYRAVGPMESRRTRELGRAPRDETDEDDYEVMLARLEEAGAGERIPPDLRKRRALFATDPWLVSDEAVVQKIIELDYRAYRRNDPSLRGIVETVAELASEITEGFYIRFLRVEEDVRGLFPQFETPDGNMPLNSLSQGTQSIIQWLARLVIGYAEYYDYPENLEDKPGILIIDEIDAHLHPSWQRRIIPALTKHFPNLQIFCSTHSPLMLAGLKQGQVQLLRRDADGKVTVSRNENDIKGWSADEILRSFLDVPSPTDLESVRQIERLQELRRIEKLSEDEAEELERLRHKVSEDMLEGPLKSQLEEFKRVLDEARVEVGKQPESSPPTGAKLKRRRRKSPSTSSSRRAPK